MSARPFYVTTPIYYVNDVPHLGNAVHDDRRRCPSPLPPVRGREARMLTGTDEHGEKVERSAAEKT